MLAAIGALTCGVGWFFGSNSGLAAMITLLIVLTGILYGAEGVRFPYIEVWGAYVATAVSQAALTALVLAGVVPDRSLIPLVVPGHPMWHHAAGHVVLQAIYLAAFLTVAPSIATASLVYRGGRCARGAPAADDEAV